MVSVPLGRRERVSCPKLPKLVLDLRRFRLRRISFSVAPDHRRRPPVNVHVAATKPAPKKPRPDLDAELNNLAMSKDAQPLFDAVMKHIEENVAPITEQFFKLGEGRKDRWSWAPGQLE